MDTGSTLEATIVNEKLCQDIRPSLEPVKMGTNTGSEVLNMEATMGGIKKTYFNPGGMANILGFAAMKDKHRITYDSDVKDSFFVHTGRGIVEFARTPQGLYAYKPSQGYLELVQKNKQQQQHYTLEQEQQHLVQLTVGAEYDDILVHDYETPDEISCLVSTQAENRSQFSNRQFEDAKRARRLCHIVGCPTVENFKHILRQHIIKNCPVTVEDVNIAEKIFGPDIGALKGKTTRKQPPRVKSDLVEIPPEIKTKYQNLEFCMDLMFVNGMPMFTGIDRTIRFRGLVPLKNRSAEALYSALDCLLRLCNKAGFRITKIYCDNEFRPLMDPVKDDLDVDMNYTSAGEHVPEAERNNRTIAERIRAAYHYLPYRAIPRVMLKHLAMNCTHHLNLFPAKGGVSPYLSPHVILGGKDLDFNKHCQIPFGAYVQANQDNNPTNDNRARTLDAIYLRPTNNEQGGHELMDLNSGLVITRNRCWEIPVTDLVIRAVEYMAEKQGIKTLKLQNRNRIRFYPVDWLAGVDYERLDQDYDSDDEDYIIEPDPVDEDQLETFDPVDADEVADLKEEEAAEPVQEEHVEEPPDEEEPGEPEPAEAEAEDPYDEDEQQPNPDNSDEPEPTTSRPRRDPKPIDRFVSYCGCQGDEQWQALEASHNIDVGFNPDMVQDYTPIEGMVLARLMVDMHGKSTQPNTSFAQQYMLQKGLKIFGDRGTAAANKEMDQLHQRDCFAPLDASTLSPSEKHKAQEALMFLTEKRDGTIKGRMVYNGKPTREWLSREDSASPTVSLESIFLTSIIDAKEKRDVMSADIPNAFIQTDMPDPKPGEDRVIMKITGVLVDLLVDMAPEVYGSYVVYEKGRKVLYVQVLKAIYGTLVASLLWYKKFRADLEDEDYEFNPYDPCVANKLINGKQHTVRFHVDDLLASHVDKNANTRFLAWLNKQYGEYGEVKAKRGLVHDYLGMTLDFSQKGVVTVDMCDYVDKMIDESSLQLKPGDIAPTPAAENLFDKGSGATLPKNMAEEFHTLVYKALFLCKRARPDLHTAVALLCTRVKSPTVDDWNKLIRMFKYCNATRKDKLFLWADDLHVIKWWVDSAFAVHDDFKSHTGACMSYGGGMAQSLSRKQKLNTRSSTESELVAPDDASVLMLWTMLFLEAQGYLIEQNILFQDNKSTIQLENNGKESSTKRTRALNIRCFFLHDQIKKGNIKVEYCPTGEMHADYFTKPLQGALFLKHKAKIMGHDPNKVKFLIPK